MDWHFYVNPNRAGKGPWMWACRIDGQHMRRMNSLDEDPNDDDINVVVLTSPLVDPQPLKKVEEKQDKGYVFALKGQELTDIQAVAVGLFLTKATRKVYRGVKVNTQSLWDRVVEHVKKEVQPVENDLWWDIPADVLTTAFENIKDFCDCHIGKASGVAKKGAFEIFQSISIVAVPIDQIVQSFRFKEGTVSPIW